MTGDELCRIRDHAAANPSHAGDVVLQLVAEVERLKLERDAVCRYAAGFLTGKPDVILKNAMMVAKYAAGLGPAPTERGTP